MLTVQSLIQFKATQVGDQFLLSLIVWSHWIHRFDILVLGREFLLFRALLSTLAGCRAAKVLFKEIIWHRFTFIEANQTLRKGRLCWKLFSFLFPNNSFVSDELTIGPFMLRIVDALISGLPQITLRKLMDEGMRVKQVFVRSVQIWCRFS